MYEAEVVTGAMFPFVTCGSQGMFRLHDRFKLF